MAGAIRQHATGSAGPGTGVSATFGSSTLAGSTIVAFLCHTAAFESQPSVNSGMTGFTWINQAWQPNRASVDGFYKDNDAGGNTTYSATGVNNVNKALVIFELTGTLTSTSLDQNGTGAGSSTTPSATTTSALAATGEIVMAGCSAPSNDATHTADAQATDSASSVGNAGTYLGEGFVSASTSAPTLGYTLTSDPWAMLICTFKASGGGGGGGGGSSGSKHPTVPNIPTLGGRT